MWLLSLVKDVLTPPPKGNNQERGIHNVQKIRNTTQQRNKKDLQSATEKEMTPWKYEYICEQPDSRIRPGKSCHHCALYYYTIFFTRRKY